MPNDKDRARWAGGREARDRRGREAEECVSAESQKREGEERRPGRTRNASWRAMRRVASVIGGAGLGAAAAWADGARLVDLSARGVAGTDANVLAVGFVTTGGDTQMVLRGVGPALANFGVTGVLAQPQLQLFNPAGAVVAANSGWDASLGPVFARVGAFGLPAGSADAALMQALPAGAYTALVTGRNGASGVALAEVYDADGAGAGGRLINLSARANSGTGANVLSGGLVIAGEGNLTVLMRGIGPTLGKLGVAGALARPVLTVFNGSATVASNAGWGGGGDRSAMFATVGAFALQPGSTDAALVVTLPAGAYTAQVTGAGGTSGVALMEIYEVPTSAPPAKKYHPGHYMMLNILSTPAQQRTLMAQNLADPNIAGFQICYTWAQLEPTKGNYGGIDSTIGSDLAYVGQSGKQLVVQLQYKSKTPGDFPADLQVTPGALLLGPDGYYIPNLWDTNRGVRDRYLALIQQIAAKYDSHPSLEMVNLAESAVVDAATTLGGTYTAQSWVDALQAIAKTAGTAFGRSTFEEYINHISGDDTLVGAACANAIAAGCGFGGPDIDPSRNNIPAYNYYAPYALTTHLGSAVQPMDYDLSGAFWYDSDHSPTTEHLFAFATSARLHVSYIFWLNDSNNANWRNAKATIDAHPLPWY